MGTSTSISCLIPSFRSKRRRFRPKGRAVWFIGWSENHPSSYENDEDMSRTTAHRKAVKRQAAYQELERDTTTTLFLGTARQEREEKGQAQLEAPIIIIPNLRLFVRLI